MPNTGGHFRTIPGTSGSQTPALAVNSDIHLPGQLAFVRDHRLYVLDGATQGVSALPAGANVQDPAYSPDGLRLAYISRGVDWSDIMVMPARGGTPQALTHNHGTSIQITCPNGVSEADAVWAANPVWAPDGQTLYYLSDEQKLALACGFLDLAIWQIGVHDGKRQLVLWPARGVDTTDAPGAGGDAQISLRPGARHEITYTRYAYAPQSNSARLVQIFLATPGNQQELALTPTTTSDGAPLQAMEASWSPDGQKLAYISRTNGADALVIMRVSKQPRGAPGFTDYASSIRLLTGDIAYPIWSPDGKSLLYLAFDNNEFDLYLVQLTFNGSNISIQSGPTQLTQGGVDGDSRPAWTDA